MSRPQNEFELRAEVYSALRAVLGDRVRGEWLSERTLLRTTKSGMRQRGARYDIVVLDPEYQKVILILEVKRNTTGEPPLKLAYYAKLEGCPVWVVNQATRAHVVERVLKFIESS